jgi:hypothetical protein
MTDTIRTAVPVLALVLAGCAALVPSIPPGASKADVDPLFIPPIRVVG